MYPPWDLYPKSMHFSFLSAKIVIMGQALLMLIED